MADNIFYGNKIFEGSASSREGEFSLAAMRMLYKGFIAVDVNIRQGMGAGFDLRWNLWYVTPLHPSYVVFPWPKSI